MVRMHRVRVLPNLPEQVGQAIQERRLFRRGEAILVAVSGGQDSMVLLQLLHALAPRFGWRLRVAHFNHRLRGRASDADERFVKHAAARLRLPIVVGRGAVAALARRRGLSIEMAARELRHQFLAQAARRHSCRRIAVAHHADDQVELFLLRLLRGAGGDGLSGMKWQSPSPADQRVKIVRPLLAVDKAVLARFAQAQRLAHREDATNASSDLLRNRIRNELLPLLRRRYQPAVDRSILRIMEIIGADAELAAGTASAWLRRKLATRRLAHESVGLQRRVIQQQLQQLDIAADFDLIESLRLRVGTCVTVSPKVRVCCDEHGRVARVPAAVAKFRRQQIALRLRGAAGGVQFSGATFRWRREAGRGTTAVAPAAGMEWFDADAVGPQIILRHWRAGDRFQPIGLGATVKLQDWFTNRKIPAGRRRELIVATTARGEIFWVEGERIGECGKLTSATRRRLVWRWERAETT